MLLDYLVHRNFKNFNTAKLRNRFNLLVLGLPSIIFLLLLLSNCSIVGIKTKAQGNGGFCWTGIVPPEEFIVIKYNNKNFELLHTPVINLTQKSQKTLLVVPAWLELPLELRLSQLSLQMQNTLADIILKIQDKRYVDEVAFSIAHLSKEEIESRHFNSQILIENAKLVYAADSQLDYVELIEYENHKKNRDFYTTARYKLKSAEGEEFYEIPKEIYYWYIVYPKVGRESLVYLDPTTGKSAPPESGGAFWRKYYLLEDKNPKRRASTHFIMEYPNFIGEEEIQFYAPYARGFLTDFEIDPVPLIIDKKSKNPVLCVFSWPGGQFDGSVIATTIPVEKEYENGSKVLLENLLVAGNASAMFSPEILDSGINEIRFAILKDRDPFGKPTIENALRELGFKFDCFNSSEIENIFTAQKEYLKIIIPSDQPFKFYKTIAEKKELFKKWMERQPFASYSLIEFHGAVARPEDDWAGIKMPWGFTSTNQVDTIKTLEIAGYPTLLSVLKETKYLWHCQPITLSGDRSLNQEACVLDRIGYFITQNQQDRCGEMPFYYRGPDCESLQVKDVAEFIQNLRSEFPQRSLYLHYGNCGEIMDEISSAGKTALVPIRNIIANCLDHVWNECYVLGKWRTFTAFRSDGGTRFDDGAYKDREVYGLMALRPDGNITNVTPNYTDSLKKIHIKILGLDGIPLDGLTATVKAEWNKGDPPPLIHTMVGWTNLNGEVDLVLQGGRDYFLFLFRPGADTVKIITGEDTTISLKLMDKLEKADEFFKEIKTNIYSKFSNVDKLATLVKANKITTDILVDVQESLLNGYSSYYNSTFLALADSGAIDLYILDSLNYENFLKKKPFSAIEIKKDIVGFHQKFSFPDSKDWYIIFSNRHRIGYSQILNFRLSLFPEMQKP